jgi:phosphate acyltransferase
LRIGVDLMGSDSPSEVLWEAVVQVAPSLEPSDELVVYATSDVVEGLSPPKGVSLVSVSQAIVMDDAPLTAIRRKRDASMVVGIKQLASRELDGFVSAGNTGALIAAAVTSLPMLNMIARPALLALLPTVHGRVAVIDIGGNISCKSEHLWQFARMGATYQRLEGGVESPRVGLLNIGTEASKGTKDLQEAYLALDSFCKAPGFTDMRFMGNIEGRDAFLGKVDVLVSDGFTGNVFLKTAEGVCTFLLECLSELFGASPPEEIRDTLKTLSHHIDYAEYPGAIVCGVEGLVVKCHGAASTRAMVNCIQGAIRLAKRNLIPAMKEALDR